MRRERRERKKGNTLVNMVEGIVMMMEVRVHGGRGRRRSEKER